MRQQLCKRGREREGVRRGGREQETEGWRGGEHAYVSDIFVRLHFLCAPAPGATGCRSWWNRHLDTMFQRFAQEGKKKTQTATSSSGFAARLKYPEADEAANRSVYVRAHTSVLAAAETQAGGLEITVLQQSQSVCVCARAHTHVLLTSPRRMSW